MEQHRSGGSLEEADIPTSLSAPQILAIMDQLTVMEATWHAGNPLAQTVYTSHYLLRQERCGSAAQRTPTKPDQSVCLVGSIYAQSRSRSGPY